MIATDDYVAFLRREYLDDFVSRGGAAVKFVVPTDSSRGNDLHTVVQDAAAASSYLFADVDAAETRVHMIDQLFFAVARQVDWDGMARSYVTRTLADLRFPVPDHLPRPLVEAVAAHHDYDAGELRRDLNRQLQQSLFRDYAMAQEFRLAMLRLCQAQLSGDDLHQDEHDAVIDWLRGDLRRITRLRSAQIFQKVARHNARHFLYSLARWCTLNGHAGLALHIDINRCAIGRRPPVDERTGVYYTKPNLMDAYEVLRQLVDSTDELSCCCVVVSAAPEFLTDDKRGLVAYTALQMRIADEVRDRNRDNPFGALVRLGEAS